MAKRIITEEELEIQNEYSRKAQKLIIGTGKKACVITYGCQQNEADSERIMGTLIDMGYLSTNNESEADIIIINTCAVREHAELRALSITGGYKNIKKQRPDLKIGICGCMVSKEGMDKTIKKSYPYVDFIFGTEHLWRLPEIVYNANMGMKKYYLNTGDATLAEGVPVRRESEFKAWVSIMYGCNNFCTYCIVPYVRGRERSRDPEDIIAEVKDLIDKGYKEINLLGQNVNSYGKEFNEKCDFSDLLERICQIPGDYIIRFISSHPKDASHKLFDTMAKHKNIENHFHLPVQSGSTNLLKKMNRIYTREQYLDLVKYMREKMPTISLTTDIIVGFPGETEEDFNETLSIMEEVRYDAIFSFIYSKREGTPAAEMEDQIPEKIKSERMTRLLELQNKIALENSEKFVGSTVRVLLEGKSKNNDSMYTGRTSENRLVHVEACDELVGKFVEVKITRAQPFALIGELITK